MVQGDASYPAPHRGSRRRRVETRRAASLEAALAMKQMKPWTCSAPPMDPDGNKRWRRNRQRKEQHHRGQGSADEKKNFCNFHMRGEASNGGKNSKGREHKEATKGN
jgi:hypothetical protein